jgi:hypothetical protein
VLWEHIPDGNVWAWAQRIGGELYIGISDDVIYAK